MNTFTVKDIMNEGPCPDYTEEVVTELWAGREELTFKEVCNLNISVEDRIWIAVRLASKATVVSWANYCADEAQKHADATTTAYWAAAATTYAAAAADAATTAAAATYAAAAAADAAADASYYAADAATYAATYASADVATYAAATYAAAAAAATAANRKTAKNKELKRLLKKLVEMNIK